MPLFQFATDRVPELARGIGGIQRPIVASPSGTSFDIGRLTSAEQAAIPLQLPRPLFVRCSFQDERRFRDTLRRGAEVDSRLRGLSSRGRDAPLVFVEANEAREAYQVAGRYKVSGGTLSLEASVFLDENEVERISVRFDAAEPDRAAGTIIRKIEDLIRRLDSDQAEGH